MPDIAQIKGQIDAIRQGFISFNVYSTYRQRTFTQPSREDISPEELVVCVCSEILREQPKEKRCNYRYTMERLECSGTLHACLYMTDVQGAKEDGLLVAMMQWTKDSVCIMAFNDAILDLMQILLGAFMGCVRIHDVSH